MVAKKVFGYWERSARRHQIQFAAAACAPQMTTGKGQMFSNTLLLKIAVRKDNQNMCANLIPQRKTQNATSSQKIPNASDDRRSKQRSSSTTRGMRGRTSIPNSRLWEGLKRNDLAAQLVLTFAQRVRFNKRPRHSLPAAKRQENKRLVRILRQEGWNQYLLMRQRAVPNRKKPGNKTGYLTQTERRTKVRLGQADAAPDTVDEQAAAALKATSSLVLSSRCVLWIDNWYRAQYTTHPDESDRSQNYTARAVLQLRQRPTYLAGHPAIEDLAARITTVARALQQRERRIPQTLRDIGYADGCAPDTGNVRAPLDVRRDARTVQAPVWRPFALSKEKVTGGVGLLNLLHFAKDTAQQTNRVLPLLADENIHYRILKLLYSAKKQRGIMRAYLRIVPVV